MKDMLSDDEVLYILADAGARVAIVDARHVSQLQDQRAQLPQLQTVIVVGDPAGGTTGKPKGVMRSQQNLYLNLFSHLTEMGLQNDECLLFTSPLKLLGYHWLPEKTAGWTRTVSCTCSTARAT